MINKARAYFGVGDGGPKLRVSGDMSLVQHNAYRIDRLEEVQAKPWEERPFGVAVQT